MQEEGFISFTTSRDNDGRTIKERGRSGLEYGY